MVNQCLQIGQVVIVQEAAKLCKLYIYCKFTGCTKLCKLHILQILNCARILLECKECIADFFKNSQSAQMFACSLTYQMI